MRTQKNPPSHDTVFIHQLLANSLQPLENNLDQQCQCNHTQCRCSSFQGSGLNCTRKGCGHHLDEHF